MPRFEMVAVGFKHGNPSTTSAVQPTTLLTENRRVRSWTGLSHDRSDRMCSYNIAFLIKMVKPAWEKLKGC